MAKKTLTPEQAEIKAMKKEKKSQNWTKFWAIVLAAVLTFGVVSLGKDQAQKAVDAAKEANNNAVVDGNDSVDNNEDDNLFGDDSSNDASNNDDANNDASNNDASNNDANNSNSSNDNSNNNSSNNSNNAANADKFTSAKAVEMFNSLTAKAAKGSYDWKRVSDYTEDGAIDLGSDFAKQTLDGIISEIADGATVDSVVGGFLGIGSKENKVTNGQAPEGMDAKYMIKAMTLKESDIKGVKQDGNVYMVQLNACSNPQKDGSNALHHATDDFFTHDEVVKGIADFTDLITVDSSDVKYSSILLKATVENDKLTKLEISYTFTAKLVLKAGISITGSGKATNEVVYSNIAY